MLLYVAKATNKRTSSNTLTSYIEPNSDRTFEHLGCMSVIKKWPGIPSNILLLAVDFLSIPITNKVPSLARSSLPVLA
ncbi:hypothetical protein CVS40_11866 [Lucilia cuprina]|nr:hypothetical protein CVS40_11866 [Lucilia cuprina]